MTTGGEAENADALRIKTEFFGLSADETNGALGVLKRGRVVLAISAFGHAIFQNDSSDANFVEPLGDFRAFEIPREDIIRAARANDHRGAGVLFGRGFHDGNGRLADVAEANDRFARHETFA